MVGDIFYLLCPYIRRETIICLEWDVCLIFAQFWFGYILLLLHTYVPFYQHSGSICERKQTGIMIAEKITLYVCFFYQ